MNWRQGRRQYGHEHKNPSLREGREGGWDEESWLLPIPRRWLQATTRYLT